MSAKIKRPAAPLLLSYLALTLLLSSCASSQTEPDPQPAAEVAAATPSANAGNSKTEELQKTIDALNLRIESLETKLSSVNDKFEASKAALDQALSGQGTRNTEVNPHPAEKFGTGIAAAPVSNDPEAGFINDEAVQSYRKAMILFQARKYPEAVLGFSAFLERQPDHPLAGSAQYYVGRAYMNQKEYRLAIQEFQRVLTSYDRSIHVTETLRDLAACEEMAQKPEDAARHRQLLTSLFPQSPATQLSRAPIQNELNTEINKGPDLDQAPALTKPATETAAAAETVGAAPAPAPAPAPAQAPAPAPPTAPMETSVQP